MVRKSTGIPTILPSPQLPKRERKGSKLLSFWQDEQIYRLWGKQKMCTFANLANCVILL